MSTLIAQLEKALHLHKSGHTSAAKALYEDILAEDQNCADAAHLLGLIYYSENDHQNALHYIHRAIEVNPENEVYQLNLGVVYNAQGEHTKAQECFNESLQINPNNVEALRNSAALSVHLKKWSDAELLYHKLYSASGDHAMLLSLAELYRNQRKNADAIRYFTRYCHQVPNNDDAYLKMGLAYDALGEKHNAIWAYSMAIQNNPQAVGAYNNMGTLYLVENDIEQAQKKFITAQHINPEDAPSGWNLAKCYFLQGRLKEAWPLYKHRWSVFGIHYMRRTFTKAEWRGESLVGKKVFLYNEQGMGDHIQNIRFVSLLKAAGAYVIMECHLSLYPLFKENFTGDILLPYGDTIPEYDYCCSLNTIPAILNLQQDEIHKGVPYLLANTDRAAYWHSLVLGDGFKFRIGVIWAGNPQHPNDALRSSSFSDFAPLFDLPGIAIYNLQVGSSSGEFPTNRQNAIDFTDQLLNYQETAALIQNLDLIITIDSSVAHLAGAMNKPVWLMLAYNPDWRWMVQREDSYWYDSIRLFRQSKPKEWGSVIAAIVDALARKLHEHKNS